jgi:hypothetical protein
LSDLRLLALLYSEEAAAPQRTAPAAANAPPPPAGPASYPKLAGAYGPDVIGLRLGMPFDEAEALIRKTIKVRQVIETNAPPAAEAATPDGLFHGKTFVAEDRPEEGLSERIAIFEAPAEAPGRVVGVERIVFFDEGLWDRISEKLVAKYGPANKSLSPSNWLVWSDRGGENCLLRQSDSHHQWHVVGTTDQGRRPVYGLETPMATRPELQAVYPRCGPVIEAYKGGGGSGADGKRLESLSTRLYDPSVLARLLRNHSVRPPSADALPMKF